MIAKGNKITKSFNYFLIFVKTKFLTTHTHSFVTFVICMIKKSFRICCFFPVLVFIIYHFTKDVIFFLNKKKLQKGLGLSVYRASSLEK